MAKTVYQPLTIPKLSWDKKTLSQTFGELTAQPLEPGFGITLGNAIRRILLGGIEGSAVTSVIIDGVNNEFSQLDGVVEDIMQLLLNIKGLVIKNKTGEPGKMTLSAHGKKGESLEFRANDIETDDHLEIVNKDHLLANVTQDGNLNITFFVTAGRGYQAAQWPVDKSLQDNKIYIDAMFSPVDKVTFRTEKTRIGKDIDYDKLILDVNTNGALDPIEVLNYAISVLRTQLEHFLIYTEIPFNKISIEPEPEVIEDVKQEESPLEGLPVELLLKPIEDLELSVRAHNCLINAGIKRIMDLVNLSEDEGLKIKNFGSKSLNEVKDIMKSFGLTFGMNIKESDVKKALELKEKEVEL